MYTTYDELYLLFLNICKTSPSNLPSLDEDKYKFIKASILAFNNTMDKNYKCNDTSETLDIKVPDNEMIIIAWHMALTYFQNEISQFTSIFSVFQKEIGITAYQAQVKAREANIIRTEQKITELITNITDSSIMM